MRQIKKLASLLLVMVMAFALAAPAFAVDPQENYNMSLASGNTHEYTVFQIFTGTPMAEGSNNFDPDTIEWGSAMPVGIRASFVNELKNDPQIGTYFASLTNSSTAKEVAQCMNNAYEKTVIGEDAVGKIIAKAAYKYLDGATGVPSTPLKQGDSKSFPTGYYMLYDNTIKSEEGMVLRRLTSNLTDIKSKDNKEPKLTKQVKDANGNFVDATDYAIDEEITFRITAVLPDNYATLDTYELKFTDIQANGFDQPENIKVYGLEENGTVGESTLKDPSTYEVNVTEHGFTLNIYDMRSATSAYKDLGNKGQVVIEYTTKLNDQAELGNSGNVNEVEMTYTGGGDPLKDDSTVFTFEFDANKVDGSTGAALEGAGFTLYKKGDSGEYDEVVKEYEGHSAKEIEDNPSLGRSKFEFTGLKQGDYMLEETMAPEGGYNEIDPIYFTIEATYKVDQASGKQVIDTFQIIRKDAEGNESAPADGNKDNGIIDMEVENNQGVVLPETGGIGTTIFYILGGILVVGAVVLLVTKRRMRTDEE